MTRKDKREGGRGVSPVVFPGLFIVSHDFAWHGKLTRGIRSILATTSETSGTGQHGHTDVGGGEHARTDLPCRAYTFSNPYALMSSCRVVVGLSSPKWAGGSGGFSMSPVERCCGGKAMSLLEASLSGVVACLEAELEEREPRNKQ